LRVGYLDAPTQSIVERGQICREIGVFVEQRLLLALARGSPGHLPDEIHYRVAVTDVGIELVERVAAERLEILLNLHLDIVPRQIETQLVAISAEFIGNRRKKDADRHARTTQNSGRAFHI
jgi:hypothetical protein